MNERFIYTGFSVADDHRTAAFRYQVHHAGQIHELCETLTFPVDLTDTPAQQRSLRALHLALGVSYYKTFLTPAIEQPYAMDESEAAFWNDVWRNGLGEFLYINRLPAKRLARFTARNDGLSFDGPDENGSSAGALLGIGGGKDSIVAGELLKQLDVPLGGFVMATGEQLGQAAGVAETMDIGLQAVKRQLDLQLLDLQKLPGAFSGHVPISLIFGLVGTALAIADHRACVVVANESAASIPRVDWNGTAVNHQWSKSFGFERQLQEYIHANITPSVTYFSAIRQLTSVAVAKLFAGYPAYFEKFTSDNSVFRIDPGKRPNGRWSLDSPKSLSSYILLAPWLDDTAVRRIFGMDLLNEPSLEALFKSLVGIEGKPPLDCVGTVEELVLSLNLLDEQGRYEDTVFMRLARDSGIVRDGAWQAERDLMLELQADQALPAGALGQDVAVKLQEALER